MLRLTLVAHAPTPAQRQFRFAADEPIDPLPSDFPTKLGDFDRALRGPERRNRETANALGLLATPCDHLHAGEQWRLRSLALEPTRTATLGHGST